MNKKILVILIVIAVIAIVAALLSIGLHKELNQSAQSPSQNQVQQVTGVSDSDLNSVGQDINASDSDFFDNSLDNLG